MKNVRGKWFRFLAMAILAGAGLFAILAFWPEPEFPSPDLAKSKPFYWNRKPLFTDLERDFASARQSAWEAVEMRFGEEESQALDLLAQMERQGPTPSPEILGLLEEVQFRLAALAAAKPALLPRFRSVSGEIRARVMRAARFWSLSPEATHEALYRIVAGGRAALEEALSQEVSPGGLPGPEKGEDVSTQCPCTFVEGVRFCAGDLLLSRGDAPGSALIARAGPWPGAFSHVAMVDILKNGAEPVVLESVIGEGTNITPIRVFLQEHRHRLLLLRPRPDAPEVLKNPRLPCTASSSLHERLVRKKAPYDFAMNPDDPSALFCAEMVYLAYGEAGMVLWPARSRLDTPGIIRLLGPLGVRQFVTLTPQDLELDPRLAAVAEWRYIHALRKDRIENALIGALFGAAERGASFRAPPFLLAESRLIRGFSNVQSFLGFPPAMPEGMNPSSAARAAGFQKHIYPTLMLAISNKAEAFRRAEGYEPPAWVLAGFAKEALNENRKHLRAFFR